MAAMLEALLTVEMILGFPAKLFIAASGVLKLEVI